MFGLVEGNNFYASCERVFQPAPRGVPLVVLSNNDGCAIARSAEAKALGIQQDLFAPAVAGDRKLMETLDQINRKFGRGVAGLEGQARLGHAAAHAVAELYDFGSRAPAGALLSHSECQ